MVKNDYSLAASDEHSMRNIKPDEGKGNVSFRDNSSNLFRIVYKMMYHIFGRVSNVDHREFTDETVFVLFCFFVLFFYLSKFLNFHSLGVLVN